MAAFENEHKFLVETVTFLGHAAEGTGIVQGYLRAENGYSVRVRLIPAQDLYELTCKAPRRGISRLEDEITLTRGQAESLLYACGDAIISKTRYPHLAPDGRLWTIDIFHGDNEGLVIAELELANLDEEFVRPDWATQEVTDDPRYYNDYIAFHPFKTWTII